jgi:hypothetical protein
VEFSQNQSILKDTNLQALTEMEAKINVSSPKTDEGTEWSNQKYEELEEELKLQIKKEVERLMETGQIQAEKQIFREKEGENQLNVGQ